MGFENPKLLHQLLTNIAENIANYAIYQVGRSSARERDEPPPPPSRPPSVRAGGRGARRERE